MGPGIRTTSTLRHASEPAAETPGRVERPLRIVFSLLHAGYLRHYAEPIRILAARGHSVHIALFRYHEQDRDAVLLHRLLADCPTVTSGRTPRRRHTDGWRGVAWIVRGLVDVLRYSDARYDASSALRERAAEKVRSRIGASRVDPLTRVVVQRALDSLARRPDAARARRYSRWLLAVEQAIPTSRRVDQLLESYRADVVLASPVVEIGSPQVEFIKGAQRLRIPSAVCVASWDNLTSKGLLRVVPDRVLVWNEIQRRELVEMHGVAPEQVVVTGGQKFDAWFERSPSRTSGQLAREVGLDPQRPYVLYLCSSAFIAPREVDFVRRWLAALRGSADPRVRELGVLVRPHPQNAGPWRDADLSEHENVVIWPREGANPDAGEAQSGFFDSIFHCAAVVGINTSAQIDAAIVGKPVYTIRAFSASQDETIHFHYLLHENGGFVRDAATFEEHVDQLSEGLADAGGRSAEVLCFIESFVRPRGLGHPVAPVVADEIEALSLARPRGRRLASVLPLRIALYPLATAMSLAAGPVAWWHRVPRPFGRRRSTASAEKALAER